MITTREEAITIIDSLHLIGCGRNQHEYDLKINVALDMAIEALKIDIVRCNNCKWYQGVHGVQGHAPCEWFNKQVLWNDFCSWGELYKGGDTE